MDACCPPLDQEVLDAEDAADLAAMLKVVADPTRLRLLHFIAQSGGDVCACDPVEALEVSQPTVSHHLKILSEAGLLDRDKRGRWVHYTLRPEALREISDALSLPVGV